MISPKEKDEPQSAARTRMIQNYCLDDSESNARARGRKGQHEEGSSDLLVGSGRVGDDDDLESVSPLEALRRALALRPPPDPGAYNQGAPGTSFRRQEKVDFSLVGRPSNISTRSTTEPAEDPTEEAGGGHDGLQWCDHTSKKRKTTCILIAIVVVAIVVVVVAVVVGVVVGMGNNNGDSSTNEADIVAEESATAAQSPLLDLVFEDPASALPHKTLEAINNGRSNNPQNQALEWLSGDPNLKEYSREQKQQRLALASLYFATNGPNWFENDEVQISNPWLDYNLHECDWFSLERKPCYNHSPTENDNMRYQHVDYNLLVLAGNEDDDNDNSPLGTVKPALRGTLVPELGMLSKLDTLDLRHQKLKGTIPTELVQLSSSLQTIILQDCFFTGTIPEGLYEFLTGMWLGRNKKLNPGTIPTTMGRNTLLTHLSLTDTSRQGPLPRELFQATHLQLIDLGWNKLTGPIPSEVGLLTSLTDLLINVNEFIMMVPSQVGLLNQLYYFLGGGNKFIGPIATEIGLLTSLVQLEMVFNQMTGTIPTQLGRLTRLTHLDLGSNNLKGILPTSLSRLSELRVFEANYNQLEGNLHPELFTTTKTTNDDSITPTTTSWPNLATLGLSDNQFIGIVPSQIGLLQSLQVLNLRSNNFESTLPPELSLLQSLEDVWIESTNLSGTIPQAMCSLPNMNRFRVDCDEVQCPTACNCVCG